MFSSPVFLDKEAKATVQTSNIAGSKNSVNFHFCEDYLKSELISTISYCEF